MAGPPMISLLSILKTLGIFVSSGAALGHDDCSGIVTIYSLQSYAYMFTM
jgi:hypothetical protein